MQANGFSLRRVDLTFACELPNIRKLKTAVIETNMNIIHILVDSV